MLRYALVYAVNSLFKIVNLMIIVRVFASWIPGLYNNSFFSGILNVIHTLTDPILEPIRRLLSKSSFGNMPIDFSPVIAILALDVIQRVILTILMAVLF